MELKTELKDYTLWYDGTIEIDPQNLGDLFLKGIDPSKIAVTELNSEVKRFNSLSQVKITTKDEVDPDKINFDWLIPEEYKSINVKDHVWQLCENKLAKFSGVDLEQRLNRVEYELNQYERRNLFDVLRVLIYVIDEFKKNNIVWGVGRGSSCASYVLYLLEVHSVDSVRYGIPIAEFFK